MGDLGCCHFDAAAASGLTADDLTAGNACVEAACVCCYPTEPVCVTTAVASAPSGVQQNLQDPQAVAGCRSQQAGLCVAVGLDVAADLTVKVAVCLAEHAAWSSAVLDDHAHAAAAVDAPE